MLKPPRRRHATKGLFRRAADDRRGVAALEFALIAPLMILLYFGLSQLSSAIIASRHANHSTSSLGDLVSQCSNINDADLTNIWTATSDILAPLPITATNFSQRVSSVKVVDANGTTKIDWSRAPTGQSSLPQYASGTTITLPNNLVSGQGDSVIMAETTYNFSFPINVLNNLIKFNDVSYFKPRRSTTVSYASGGTSCYSS